MDIGVDHLILTRFNLPTPGPESLVRAQDGWLRNRVELFERHTVASVRRQTLSDFTWIVYLDPASPAWLRAQLRPLIEEGVFTPLWRESVSWREVVRDARTLFPRPQEVLLTTNLDNDDAIAVDFVERLHDAARRHPSSALYLRSGIIMRGERVYRNNDPRNAFCSVSETWEHPITAWRDWHNRLHLHRREIVLSGAPAWLQVVHGQNVSNRARGLLTSPRRYDDLFVGQLEALPQPGVGARLCDRLVLRPARVMRDTARRLFVAAVLRVVGKRGLDAVKASLRRVRAR